VQKCSMCNELSDLQNSHAIPDAFFRKILKSNSGKAIVVPGGNEEPIHYSSDSRDTQQLCATCEIHLNKSYETYAIKLIRWSVGSFNKHSEGVTFSCVDTNILINFLISVFWRAANSKHPYYDKVHIPEPWNAEIRDALRGNYKVKSKLITIKFSRLIDRTPNDGFTLNSLKGVIFTPLFRRYEYGRYSFCFIFEGFFTEIYMPGLKISERKKKGVLSYNSNVIFAPYLDIFDVPEIKRVLIEGYAKYVEGAVTFEN